VAWFADHGVEVAGILVVGWIGWDARRRVKKLEEARRFDEQARKAIREKLAAFSEEGGAIIGRAQSALSRTDPNRLDRPLHGKDPVAKVGDEEAAWRATVAAYLRDEPLLGAEYESRFRAPVHEVVLYPGEPYSTRSVQSVETLISARQARLDAFINELRSPDSAR
jgi:hypothetical protein